jgi:hypothetical protein
MKLVKSYSADKKVICQVRDFIKADTGPEVNSGFVNMMFIIEDNNTLNVILRKQRDNTISSFMIFRQ